MSAQKSRPGSSVYGSMANSGFKTLRESNMLNSSVNSTSLASVKVARQQTDGAYYSARRNNSNVRERTPFKSPRKEKLNAALAQYKER